MLGVGGSVTSENIGQEIFTGEESVCIIYELTKAGGGEATLALGGLDVLGRARNGFGQDTAAGILVRGCWFELVDLIIVLGAKYVP